MSVRRLPAALATATAGLALVAGAFGPGALASPAADPAGEPRLLEVAELPTARPFSSWETSPVQLLEDKFLCEEEALPSVGTGMRIFYNADAGTTLTQYAARFESKAAARKAVRAISRCFSLRYLTADRPDEDLRVKDLGKFGLKDGLTLGAVITPDPGGPDSKFLWSLGRDNTYVTLLEFPLATDDASPKKEWVALSKHALKRVAP